MIWGKQFLSSIIIGLFLPCAILLWIPATAGGQSVPDDSMVLPRTSALLQDSILLGASTYLEPNRPNPFIGTTRIAYSLAEATPVRLRIYDLFFDPVETLVDLPLQDAGLHEVSFTPRGISSGMYLYELKTNQGVELKRMLYIR
jgi:hypothetical protein